MSEASSDTEMSDQEHASLLDFVLEASDENQNFAASNVAEIMENFVCPPHHSNSTPTYTDLSSNNYCNFDAGGGETQQHYTSYINGSPSPLGSHLVSYSAADGTDAQHTAGKHPSNSSSDWERSPGYIDVATGQWTSQYNFPQQIDCINNSSYSSSVPYAETNQQFQSKEFHSLSKSNQHQLHHVSHRRQNSNTSSKAPKRRRVTTVPQRKAANIRERRRMFNLNEAFDILRKRVPAFSYEKRLSRIDTLRLAVVYIGFMEDVLNGKKVDQVKLRELESQFAELKAANALPSASRPKPKNSSSNGRTRNTRASRKAAEEAK